MSSEGPGPSVRALTGLVGAVVFVALIIALALGVSPNVDTQLVALGEWFWPGYANELRMDPERPTCDLEEVEQRLADCPADGGGAAAPVDPDDPFGGEDPFGDGAGAAAPTDAPTDDPFAGEDPFAEEGGDGPAEPDADDPFAGEDPFAEEGGADGPAEPDADDPFAGEDPFAEEGGADAPAGPPTDDPFAGEDPFADEPAAAAAGATNAAECEGLRAFRDTCQARWDTYEAIQARLTPTNKAYRNVEVFVGNLAKFPYWKHLLIVLVVLGGLNTTLLRVHIALREPRTRLEHVLAQGSQLVAHGFLLASGIADYRVQILSEAEPEQPELALMWALGFGLLALVNVWHLIRPPGGLDGKGHWGRLLMVIPLFAYMAIISGVYFVGWEQYVAGQAAYLSKFLQVPSVYLGIGLYIWAGMLFSITRFATLVFGLLRPWQLPPAILSWLVVVLAAVPTAYSGASGIFVLAAGAVIFGQLRHAGANKRMALAATAMSGSLGVVLAPCLVVVLIAMLNSEVQTSELFGAGIWVFALTAVLALAAFLIRNDQPFKLPDMGEALGGTGRAIVALLPFVALGAVIMVVYYYVLGTDVSEHTAMLVLPAVLLGVVIYDRSFAGERVNGEVLPRPTEGVWKPVINATTESSEHIGALLMLMVCSIGIGGVVERTQLMEAFPASLGGPYATMAVLVVVMVLVGMTMDALGAVVLVSVSVATLAYDAGIHPVHFWMMVLVAFELGYLTPPVALNHLLARQVIGEESHVEDDDTVGLWARNEHIVLPMLVMGIALVLVAFGGFVFYAPG